MAASTLVDLVSIQVNTGGIGPLVLGQAMPGFRGTEALADGTTYSYSIQQGDQYEAGTFVYLHASNTAVRTVSISSNGNAPITVGGGWALTVTALAKDLDAVTGGVNALAAELAAPTGAALIGTGSGDTLQESLNGKATLGTNNFSGTQTAPEFDGALNGNAATASKLANARTIALTGEVTGSASFDGSGNVSAATTLSPSAAALVAILNGSVAWNLPEEANGDVLPPAGSKRPYLSGGVLKIA